MLFLKDMRRSGCSTLRIITRNMARPKPAIKERKGEGGRESSRVSDSHIFRDLNQEAVIRVLTREMNVYLFADLSIR